MQFNVDAWTDFYPTMIATVLFPKKSELISLLEYEENRISMTSTMAMAIIETNAPTSAKMNIDISSIMAAVCFWGQTKHHKQDFDLI